MITLDNFKGMDNRHRAERLPDGFSRNAVNTVFDDLNRAARVHGATQVYAGTNVHSWWESDRDTEKGYFIEGNDLKRLNNDFTAYTLGTIGSTRAGFARIGNLIYVGNSSSGYVIDGDNLRSLGIAWPEYQPTLTAREMGGMFAGDYQVAITFKRNGEESGCGVASTITLSDGEGIYFSIPPVPADVDEIAVWCSSVNDNSLWLYNEYPASTTEVFIDSHLSDIPLKTQHLYPPVPSDIIKVHYGRIYWADGSLLRYTEPLTFGYTKAFNAMPFEGEVTLIASVPGALYVCADKTYRISNIDLEGLKQRVEIFPYGAVKGTLMYDTRSQTAFWQSHKGIVAASNEGAVELVADHIAMPKYNKGTMTITEQNGVRQLITVSQGGEPSNLMDAEMKADEIVRVGKAL